MLNSNRMLVGLTCMPCRVNDRNQLSDRSIPIDHEMGTRTSSSRTSFECGYSPGRCGALGDMQYDCIPIGDCADLEMIVEWLLFGEWTPAA